MTLIHQAVYEYIQGIGKTLSPTGESVRVNLPEAATPQPPANNIESGSFGPVTANNHNAYECYFSPYISKKLIQRTLVANEFGRAAANYLDWNPFPEGTFPCGSTPTANLLGYYRPQILHHIMVRQLLQTFKLRIFNQQHGFCKGRSTATNLMAFSEFLHRHLDVHGQVDVVYTEAFDKVSHTNLFQKFRNSNIYADLLYVG